MTDAQANAEHLYDCQACISNESVKSACIDIVTAMGIDADRAGGTVDEYQAGLAMLIERIHAQSHRRNGQ
jgi:hypothetical protein